MSCFKNSLEVPLWHKKWVCLFKMLKNSHVSPWWKTLARNYWIDLQITVGKDDSSGYGMIEGRWSEVGSIPQSWVWLAVHKRLPPALVLRLLGA